MDTEELYQRGIALCRQSFGDAAVAVPTNAPGEFGAPLQNVSGAHSYRDVRSRRQLDLPSRGMAMLANAAAPGKPNELSEHESGALGNDVSAGQSRAVPLLVTPYAGLPAGIDAHQAALAAIEAHAQRDAVR